MNTFRLIILLFALALPAFAQSTNRITIQLVLTNATSNNFALTLNGDTRVFTNAVTQPASQIITNHSISGSASNLYNHLAASAFSRVRAYGYTNGSNTIYLRGDLGLSMSATILSNWATLSYSTQVFSSGLIDVRVPIETETAAQGTNIASLLARAIGNLATNGIRADATALTNFVGKTNEATLARKTLTGPFINDGTNSGTLLTNIPRANINLLVATNSTTFGGTHSNVTLTNIPWINARAGYLSNIIAHTVTITNLSAPGSGTDSQQIGAGALATNGSSIAFGVNSRAYGSQGIAIGTDSYVTDFANTGIALGDTALSTNVQAIAIGRNTIAGGKWSLAIGRQAKSYHTNSAAIGVDSLTTDHYQIRLGTSTEHVSIPGRIEAMSGSISNIVGSNTFSGSFSLQSGTVSTLVNGNNAGIILSTNPVVELSGATTIAQIAGFAASRDGDTRLLRFTGAITNWIVNEANSSFSTDPTAANRIVTGTGGDFYQTNQPAWVKIRYRATSSRWEVLDKSN